MKLLELPERAKLVGAGAIALSAVDSCARSDRCQRRCSTRCMDFLCDGNEWAAERLAREPGWVLDTALRDGDSNVFAAQLSTVDDYDMRELKLGKKADRANGKAAELHKQLDRYATAARGAVHRCRGRPGPRRRRDDRVEARRR